ncbi:MAG TPA: hypothetical protein VFK79_07330 [Xanthobacteraceae bacterium]|nr:hypothetical protein [Xanthobacteraceae bacterium]
MQRFHHGVIAVALLAATSVAFAQQEKTQQNSADEALTRSAPEAKDQPQAPPAVRQNEASQPGLENTDPLAGGKLVAPGAPQGTQDEPAKSSAKNDKLDKTPIMAYPLALTDEQKRAIYQRLTQGAASASAITAKPSEQVPATLALQELPPEMAASMPSVADYKFLRLNDRILVVNPRESIVVGEITN